MDSPCIVFTFKAQAKSVSLFMCSNIYFSLVLQSQYATPLLLAASGGHKEVVEVLIANGASASDEDAVRTQW